MLCHLSLDTITEGSFHEPKVPKQRADLIELLRRVCHATEARQERLLQIFAIVGLESGQIVHRSEPAAIW